MGLQNVISLSTAGGGKTTRLIQRVQTILDLNNNDQSRILIISFTNASCEDIRARCGIKAETLHSFCYRFLPSKFTIEEDISRFTNIFLGKFFTLSQLGEITVNRLLNSYFIFKTFPIDDLPLFEKDKKMNQEFKELVDLISQEKINHSCLFFSDIIHEFLEQLNTFLLDISTYYDHILVDEAQDLSELQLQILAKIIQDVFIDNNKSFFIVGDVKQSIYNFQGASPEIYIKFINELQTLCESKNIPLELENNETTYRFGGEILNKINQHFVAHYSEKQEGKYIQVMIDEYRDIEGKVTEIVEKHLLDTRPEDIMILFERSGALIEGLQNKFSGLGLNLKIYLQNNKIIDGLKDIVGFLQTEMNYFAAKILQGPFFHLTEPHFYLLNQVINKDLTQYNQAFFSQIKILRFYPDLLLKYLMQRKVFAKTTDLRLLESIYDLSHRYTSIDSLVIDLPECIKLQENGIQFTTIHSSKGLEADVVILLPQNKKADKLTINLNPFFFFVHDCNDFTKYIIDENKKQNFQNKSNLYYVALTRAKKYLYEISLGHFF